MVYAAGNDLLLMLNPEIRTHSLRLMHARVLIIQVLSVLNILLSVWIGVRIVGLLRARERLVTGGLPSVAWQVGTARHAAVL